MMDLEAEIVKSRPVLSKPPKPKTKSALPRSGKRHSLQNTDSITKFNKLKRHSSQPKLRGEITGSLSNLNLDGSKEKSSSYAQLETLKASGKTLSASNLLALSDSNLSVQEALPARSYDSANINSRSHFERRVKTIFFQLTEGCGNEKCTNKFCFSNWFGAKLRPEHAAFLSMELAARNKNCLCSVEKTESSALPLSLQAPSDGKTKSFLQAMLSCTPFKTLFTDAPQEQQVLESKPKKTPSVGNLVSDSALVMNGLSRRQSLPLNTSGITSQMISRSLTNLNKNKTKSLLGLSIDHLKNDAKLSTTSTISCHTNPSVNDSLSSSNISGNLITDELPMPTEFEEAYGSNSSLNDYTALEEFERECILEMSIGHIKDFSLTHLTLPMLQSSVDTYLECNDPSFLVNTIRTVFTSPEALNTSFRKDSRSSENGPDENFDLDAVRRAYELILQLRPQETFIPPLINATEIVLTSMRSSVIKPGDVYQLLIILENPLLVDSAGLLGKLCNIIVNLPEESRSTLVTILSKYKSQHLLSLIQIFQKFLSSQTHQKQCSEQSLIEICHVLALFYDARGISVQGKKESVPITSFYNEDLSKKLDFKTEFEKWSPNTECCRPWQSSESTEDKRLSFFDFPFLLDPASKVRVMHIDAVMQMRVEYQNAIVHQARVQQAQKVFEETKKRNNELQDSIKSAMCPFLVLEIHRDKLIEDTLLQINVKAEDLKKPLKIKYVGGGEEGLDMGGLQKEFFHLIVEAIFDPGYGMFVYLEESRVSWINGLSLESEREFELVGIVLGLAIYNGVILDVHFPSVVYKKLLGGKVELEDLVEVSPSIASSLQDLLKHEEEVEDIFCFTFQVSETDQFGGVTSTDLLPGGSSIPVTNQNREQFVQLYVEHLLDKSVAKQFNAFAQGFLKVCGGRALGLFSPHELELLICGSPVLDFSSLKQSATYEEGFSSKHQIIKQFWEVMDEISHEQKKAVLLFVTGSDRVPLKGLSNLTFIIQRNGPDSDRLPTAMTCFNRLLLPEYTDKKKLKARLLVAIQNCKGFGLT